MPASQVKFYKGDQQVYSASPSSYVDGLFFDTTNHEIYLNNVKYSEKRWSYLSDASVLVVDSVAYLGLDFETYLNDVPKYVRLPRVHSSGAIDTSVFPETGDVSVTLKLDNTGNSEVWLAQTDLGLQFDEDILAAHTINGVGIISNGWIDAADISIGSIPAVSDSSLAISVDDTVALAIQKVKRLAEVNEIAAIKYIHLRAEDGTLKEDLNQTDILEDLDIKDGSFILVEHPSGDSSNTLVVSTTLHAGSNITIDSDGAINAEGGTYWNEID